MTYVRLTDGTTRPVVLRDGVECVELAMWLPCLECFPGGDPECGECDGLGHTWQEWREPVESFVVEEGE